MISGWLIPRFDGAMPSREWKDAPRDRVVTRSPRPRSPSGRPYRDRKLHPCGKAGNPASAPGRPEHGAVQVAFSRKTVPWEVWSPLLAGSPSQGWFGLSAVPDAAGPAGKGGGSSPAAAAGCVHCPRLGAGRAAEMPAVTRGRGADVCASRGAVPRRAKGGMGQREGLIARDAALPRREDFHQENLATAKRLRLDGLRG